MLNVSIFKDMVFEREIAINRVIWVGRYVVVKGELFVQVNDETMNEEIRKKDLKRS